MPLSVLRQLYYYNGRRLIGIGRFRSRILEEFRQKRCEIFNSAKLLESKSSADLSSSSSSDSSSESSDEETDNKKEVKSQNYSTVQKRLNMLLSSMPTENSKGELVHGFERDFSKKMDIAAKQVAETFGGDVKKTQSELLNRLLARVEERSQTIKAPETSKSSVNLSELIVGMKIDRTPKASPEARSVRSISEEMIEQTTRTKRERFDPSSVRRTSRDHLRPKMPLPKVNLFGEEVLGIFQSAVSFQESPVLSTWKYLHERELRLSVTHPPANIYEEMVLWTKKGLLWKFPINNEQGEEEAANVSFTEHIFLEVHLKPWCPQKGPIRHFMELVCVGLSKNPYFTPEEKKGHILWYRDYFTEKIALLEKMGLSLNTEPQKTIE